MSDMICLMFLNIEIEPLPAWDETLLFPMPGIIVARLQVSASDQTT